MKRLFKQTVGSYAVLTMFFVTILFLSVVAFSPATKDLGFAKTAGMVVDDQSFIFAFEESASVTSPEDSASSVSWLSTLLIGFFVFSILLTITFLTDPFSSSRKDLELSSQESFLASLTSYILAQRKKGYSDTVIAQHLSKQGFSQKDVLHACRLMNHHDDVLDVKAMFSSYNEYACDLDVLEKAAIKEGIHPVIVRSAKEQLV
ncbi:MAG: hypothetical protein ACOCQQ_02255 [Candidatus Nanoarchaeia archaeon]